MDSEPGPPTEMMGSEPGPPTEMMGSGDEQHMQHVQVQSSVSPCSIFLKISPF